MRTTQRVAGFRSECPAGFELECMAGFVGIRILVEFGTSQIWFENVMPGQITFDGDFVFDTSGGGDNHAPTNATLSGGSVAENAGNGTAVGTVAGVDPDAGAVLSYSLTNNAGGRFAINAATGQITVARGWQRHPARRCRR
ncbi:hypothetical protein ACVMII_005402 [Bradyrhizobium diazoefficiens]